MNRRALKDRIEGAGMGFYRTGALGFCIIAEGKIAFLGHYEAAHEWADRKGIAS